MWWDYKSQALFNRGYFIFILYFVGGKNKNVAVMMTWWQIKHFSWQRYIHAYICICLGYNIISRASTSKFFDQCLLHQIAREIMLLLVNDVHEKKPHRKSRQMKFWLHSHAICNLHLFYMKNALVSANQMQAIFSCIL